MRNIVNIIFSIGVLISVIGCSNIRHLPIDEHKDSTVINYRDSLRIRDSVVFVSIPRESSSSETILPSSDTSHLETSIAKSDAWIDTTGRLHHTLDNKSGEKLPAVVPVYDRVRTTDKDFSHTLTVTRTIEKPLSWWQRCLMTLGKIFIGVLAAAFVFMLVKILSKLRT